MSERIIEIATQARRELENGDVDQKLLVRLYQQYNSRVEDINGFIKSGISMFPQLCCGIASVYLKHLLGDGEIVIGQYNKEPHTLLLVNGELVDITSDQYDGLPVYVGALKEPWQI